MDERHVFTVTELNHRVKDLVEAVPAFSDLLLRGEISNYKVYPSGHHYFTLKDSESALRCVMFKGSAVKLRFKPENGMQVIASGRISVYPRDGAYQLYCSGLSADGVGDLYVAFEQLKEKLYREGLFDPAHKKPLPRFPRRIAIVTSSAGAAVHDMIRILRRRYPIAKVLLLPVRVQGVEAPPEIVGAIRYANRYQLADVLITGRGGGSLEDLWAFNDERVARAIYACETPVISAVGHETDFTIADFVADMRAPTPSAAAELAVFDYAQWCERIRQYEDTLYRAMSEKIRAYRNRLASLNMELRNSAPERRLLDNKQYLDSLRLRLDNCMDRMMENYRHRFKLSATRLSGLSPLSKISGGFGYLEDSRGKTIRSIEDVERGEYIKIIVSDGSISAAVADKEKM